MKFQQGNTLGKGRPKNSLNKQTVKIRDAFAALLENNLEQLNNDFAELEPEKRIKLFLDMAKYIIPTLKQTELEVSDPGVKQLEITLVEEGYNTDKF